MPRGFQVVEAKAGHDAAQIRFRLAHRVAVRIEPAQKRLLDHILRIRDRSQHPVGDADQSWTQRIERGGGVLAGHGFPQPPSPPWTPWTPPPPPWPRFPPL